jgi:hypothetical protein
LDSNCGGDKYPTTLTGAIAIAQQFVTPARAGHGGSQAAFAAEAGERNANRSFKDRDQDREQKKGASNDKKSPPVCWNCDEVGHVQANCPHPRKDEKDDDSEATAPKKSSSKKSKKKTKQGKPEAKVHYAEEADFEDAFPLVAAAVDESGSDDRNIEEIISPAVESFQKHGCYDNLHIHLDNQATASLFNNEELLHDVKVVDPPMVFRGVGGAILAEKRGLFRDYGLVWLSKLAPINIVSFSALVKARRLTVGYDSDTNEFYVEHRDGQRDVYSMTKAGLYQLSLESQEVHLSREEKDSALPLAEISRARAARQLWDRIGPVSKEQIKIAALRSPGEGIGPKDVETSIKVYGPHPGCAAGRATEPKSPRERGDRQLALPQQRVKFQSDLMFIQDYTFLMTRVNPIGLALATFMGNGKKFKSTNHVEAALRGQIVTVGSYNFLCVNIFCSMESQLWRS